MTIILDRKGGLEAKVSDHGVGNHLSAAYAVCV